MEILNLNRTNDAVFKTIFANQQHKDITLSLINAVFEFQGTGQIKDITFIDRELVHRARNTWANYLSEFPSAALSSIGIATAMHHSSALQLKIHPAYF